MFKEDINYEVRIPLDGMSLEGDVQIPKNANRIVLFVHGSGSNRFSPRNIYVAKVLQKELEGKTYKLRYFGASTGAAFAINAAAAKGNKIYAVVSRGGRPDIATPDALPQVICPTLLIAGGEDLEVLELNKQAYTHLTCEKNWQ